MAEFNLQAYAGLVGIGRSLARAGGEKQIRRDKAYDLFIRLSADPRYALTNPDTSYTQGMTAVDVKKLFKLSDSQAWAGNIEIDVDTLKVIQQTMQKTNPDIKFDITTPKSKAEIDVIARFLQIDVTSENAKDRIELAVARLKEQKLRNRVNLFEAWLKIDPVDRERMTEEYNEVINYMMNEDAKPLAIQDVTKYEKLRDLKPDFYDALLDIPGLGSMLKRQELRQVTDDINQDTDIPNEGDEQIWQEIIKQYPTIKKDPVSKAEAIKRYKAQGQKITVPGTAGTPIESQLQETFGGQSPQTGLRPQPQRGQQRPTQKPGTSVFDGIRSKLDPMKYIRTLAYLRGK